jgi:hypothetical protein
LITSEATDLIAPAWVKALNALTDIVREHTANTGTYTYKYADLATAAQQGRTVLAEHELAVHQAAHGATLGAVEVTTTVWHSSGQWIEAPPLTMPAKGGPQDVGSAISYARRYAFMAFLGLATDDDDGAGAQRAAEKAAKPHPLSGRVAEVMTDMKRLTDTGKDALKAWADGRKLSGSQLLADEQWLANVESWLDEFNSRPQVDARDADPSSEGLISSAQIRKMAVSFKEQGITERSDRLAFIVDVVGHPVDSSKELTKGEASQVIEALVTDNVTPDDNSQRQLEGEES